MSQKPEERTALNLRLPNEIHAKLKLLCKLEERSLHFLAVKAIKEFLAKHELTQGGTQ